MGKLTAAVTAVGGYVPPDILSNADLEQMVETTDEWIRTRTGIKERRILKERGAGPSHMGSKAAADALNKRGIDASEVDLVICATVTADYMFPATSNLISYNIGAKNAWSFDLGAACSGFLFALTTGVQYIESGRYKKVLVVGADKMSSIVDYTDRSTCIIFGDGAGAVLLEGNEENYGILDFKNRVDGSGGKYLHQKAGGSAKPASIATVEAKEHFIYQEGKAVFKFAVSKMADISAEIMEDNHLSAEDVAWLVPHQANMRIIEATARRMNLDMSKVMVNIHRFGNTTAATIPLCLWEWQDQLKKGDNLILSAFGGGFTWAATYLRWAYNS